MGQILDFSGEELATTARAMARPQRIQVSLRGMEFVSNDSEFERKLYKILLSLLRKQNV
jgi:hypothetical protein